MLEILDASGHTSLTWDPADEASVARAREEWDRLKAAGFAFFAEGVGEVSTPDYASKPQGCGLEARLAAVPVPEEPATEPVREFSPRRRRTTAVRPMRGG